MKMSRFKAVILSLLMAIFSVNVFANELLTLDQLREEVLDENIDVKIQYEKYYQAQQNVRVKLGEFAPSLNFQLLFWNTTYAVLYSVTPTPSNWFNYQSSQELAIAERYISESIKLNILRDLTLTYMSIRHQEKMKETMVREEESLQVAYDRALNLEELGFGDATQTFTIYRTLLKHRQDIFALESVIAAQKEALYLSLNRRPGTEIELADFTPSMNDIPETVEQAIEIAFANSPELKANLFMQEGARYMVSSAKWSFVSFSGIGLGYPATVRIEKSKLKEIQLKREKLENQIANQIDLAYSKLENLGMRIENQNQILFGTQIELDKTQELYELGQATLDELVRAQTAVLKEERDLITLVMSKDIQTIEIKRLLGLDATNNNLETREMNSIALNTYVDNQFRKTKLTVDLDVPSHLVNDVVSVTYAGDVFDYRIENKTGNFSLFTKTSARGTQRVEAQVLFTSGQTLFLESSVEL